MKVHHMNNKNQTDKAVRTLVDGIKDAVDANIISAVRSKQLDVKPEQLTMLLSLVKASIEEGYLKGSRVFFRSVVDSSTSTVTNVTKKKTASSTQ